MMMNNPSVIIRITISSLLQDRIEKAPALFASMPSAIFGSIRISALPLIFNRYSRLFVSITVYNRL